MPYLLIVNMKSYRPAARYLSMVNVKSYQPQKLIPLRIFWRLFGTRVINPLPIISQRQM
jgi:hypothetical protein